MELQGMGNDMQSLLNNVISHFVLKRDGRRETLRDEKILAALTRACEGYERDVSLVDLFAEVKRTIFDGIKTTEIEKACILAAVALLERDPAYDIIAMRLLLQKLLREVHGPAKIKQDRVAAYRATFVETITGAVAQGLLDERMLAYPLHELAAYMDVSRDNLLKYMGLHTLYERYFLKIDGRRVEMPQMFWMRIAMGLALHETNPVERACEFYDVLSQLRYVPSTPTLFHAGFPVAQLSSCYLTTINDDLTHIFKCMGDNAQLSKWAGSPVISRK